MQTLLDSLIIETYSQLAFVATIVVAAIVLGFALRRRRKARLAKSPKLIGARRPLIAVPRSGPRPQPARKTNGMDFDKMADMIAVATNRAGHISETQSAAALKIDTAEMAVNRLIADIDPLMAVPKTVRPVLVDPTKASGPVAA